MAERKNPYIGWTLGRLEDHKKRIEEAINFTKLRLDNFYDARGFREVHSLPECVLEKFDEESWPVGKPNIEGIQVIAIYYRLRCAAHKVSSSE